MNSRQVGFVLMALIALGLAGLIGRVVSSGSDELVLSGLLPIDRSFINRVTFKSEDSEAKLERSGDVWTIRNQPVFVPKLAQFWAAVSQIDGAQLIAKNTANHERMRVTEEQGTVVSFFLGKFVQERFIMGEPTPDVRLCYLRRSGNDDVYGIPCSGPNIFDPDPDGWRNPVFVSIPSAEVESVTFTYPDEEFVLKISDGQWMIAAGGEDQPADLRQVGSVLGTLELIVASAFVDDEEADGLDFGFSDASLRVVTREGATTPTTRLRFLERDDTSYYASTPVQATVFIVDRGVVDGLLKRQQDFLPDTGG